MGDCRTASGLLNLVDSPDMGVIVGLDLTITP